MKTSIKQRVVRLNRMDTFSPYFFLPFILLLYFFTSLFDFHRFELFNVHTSIWPAVMIAMLSYYVGVYVVDKKGGPSHRSGYRFCVAIQYGPFGCLR